MKKNKKNKKDSRIIDENKSIKNTFIFQWIYENILSIFLSIIIIGIISYFVVNNYNSNYINKINNFNDEISIVTNTIGRLNNDGSPTFDKIITQRSITTSGQIPNEFIEGTHIITPWGGYFKWLENVDRLTFVIEVPYSECKYIQTHWENNNIIPNFNNDYCKYGVIVFDYFKNNNTFAIKRNDMNITNINESQINDIKADNLLDKQEYEKSKK